MKSTLRLVLLLWLAFMGAAYADALDKIKKDGVLVVGVRNAMRPFGFIDKKSMELVGYDIDFARAIAGKLGVKLQFRSSDEPLIPLLREGRIDLIAGAMTRTAERMEQCDFSVTYYVTRQTFLVRKGTVRTLADLNAQKIGTSQKSTAARNLKKVLPDSTAVLFQGYTNAFRALKSGRIQAISTDETILAGLLAADPQKAEFEILDANISDEFYGLAVRKGNPQFLAAVDQTLLELERSGEAAKIYDKWFGKDSPLAIKRLFTITAGK